MIELDISFMTEAMWVEPKIWNNNLNRLSTCPMLFDTGATMTAISVQAARRSGFSLNSADVVYVKGIGGLIQGHCITVREFWLGSLNLGAASVYVLPFAENSDVQAVLGMNIIKEFITTIDLTKKNKFGSDGILLMFPAFDTNDIKTLDTFDSKNSRFGAWNLSYRSAESNISLTPDEHRILDFFKYHYPETIEYDTPYLAEVRMIASKTQLRSLVRKGFLINEKGSYRILNKEYF